MADGPGSRGHRRRPRRPHPRRAGQRRQVQGQLRPRRHREDHRPPAPRARSRSRSTTRSDPIWWTILQTVPALRAAHRRLPVRHEHHAGRRQPGHAVRQGQGQAGQQGPAQGHLRRRRRRRRGRRGAAGDQGVPGGAGQVPGHGGQDPQGRPAVRAPRAPARPSWPGPWPARPACPSSPSPARTSWRCSSAWAPAGCATCSSRPSSRRRPSSSSTRSTPSGRHRGAGLGGGHDEREQTLNQLLVEMDGFDTKAGVILIAATNRPDILDPALLRPGRFDRQIVVDRPDLEGRRAILNVHAKNKPLAKGVDVDILARRTPGFTGADLANLMNEAALLAARRGFEEIGMPQLEEAVDRVIAGPERKSRLMSETGEAGHRLPRGRPRPGRPRPARRRPHPQDLDHRPGPGPGLDPRPAHRGQVPHLPLGPARPAGHAAWAGARPRS